MNNLEEEIKTLFKDFESLRLPHKLNKYRQYHQQIKSLRSLSAKLNPKESSTYSGQLDELEKRLDASVICAINQCAICSQCNDTNSLRGGRRILFTRSRSMAPTYGRVDLFTVQETKQENIKMTNNGKAENESIVKKNTNPFLNKDGETPETNVVNKTSEQPTDYKYKGMEQMTTKKIDF